MDKRYFKDWTCLPFVGQGGLGSGCLVVDAVGVHPVVEVEPWDISCKTPRQLDNHTIRQSDN